MSETKEKRTPLQLEIDEINRLKRKHPETKAFTTAFISKLKSKVEKRGDVPKSELDRLRKVFKAAISSLEEDGTDE